MPVGPSKKNILYGKGIVYVAPLDDDYVPQGEIDFGECPMFELEPVTEEDTIFSSRTGIRETAFSAIVQRELTVRFTTRDYNRESINRAFLGDGFPAVSQGSGYEPDDQITVHTLDRWYPLAKRDCTDIVVKNEAGDTTYTLDTDYKTRAQTNRITMVMPMSDGSISEDDVIVVSYNYTAWSAVEVRPLTDVDVLCRIHFAGDPEYGPIMEANLWLVQLRCSAALPLISDESATIEFEGKTLEDRDNHSADPFGEIHINEDWTT